jgi:hypothetical protein
MYSIGKQGRDTAQAVSHRLPTATAGVRARVKSSGICGGQSGTRAGFLRVVRFSLPIRIPPVSPHSSSIIRGWNNRPNSGRSTKGTQSHPHEKKNTKRATINSLKKCSDAWSWILLADADQLLKIDGVLYIYLFNNNYCFVCARWCWLTAMNKITQLWRGSLLAKRPASSQKDSAAWSYEEPGCWA